MINRIAHLLREQPDLFGQKATARSSDPDTSHEAAARVNKTISESQANVREAMRLLGPACDEDLQNFYDANRVVYGWPDHRCVRKRRLELVRAGIAEFSGRYVRNPVGGRVKEWRLT